MPDQQPQVDYDKLAQDLGGFSVSHGDAPTPPEHPHARTWRLVKENLPAIGAAGAVTATGGTALIPAAIAAGLGGAGGYGMQQTIKAAGGEETEAKTSGDVLSGMAVKGAKEGVIQLVGGGLVKAGGRIARGLMQGTVPKNIAKDFAGQVDIPQEMLNRGVLPGSQRSARRISGLSKAANAERDAAAQVVPNMPRRKVIEGLRPIHAEGVMGKEPKVAQGALEHMRESARNIGPGGLSGPQALARKDIQQRMGTAALNNPQTAAMAPQLHDAERAAIVSHLRETPRMASALDESQTLMAIDQVMQDAALSNTVTRARIGGLTAASMSPVGLGATAHVVNQGSKAFNPTTIRLLDAIMRGGSQ